MVMIFLGECSSIGDRGIVCSEGVCGVGLIGDRSGMCGKDVVVVCVCDGFIHVFIQ